MKMSFKELFDCELLIAEVEKRPALYDMNLKQYSDKNLKEKLWTEVCETVVNDWSNLSPVEKYQKEKQIQRRWKSLRECFRREVKLLQKSGYGAINKRKYIYFDKLLFLTKFFNEPETTNNSLTHEDQDGEDEEGDTLDSSMNADIPEIYHMHSKIRDSHDPYEFLSIGDEPQSEGSQEYNATKAKLRKRKAKEYPERCYEEEIIEILKDKSKALDCDEDKAFLMSLLPKFRKFSDEQRFEAQIEIMKVLRKVQLMPTQGPSTSYHNSNFQSQCTSAQQQLQTHLQTFHEGFGGDAERMESEKWVVVKTEDE